jgi:hypothetical protein
MTEKERSALLYGPYTTPAFRWYSVVRCEFRGDVTIVALTDARIPWPVGKTTRAKSLVIYGDLAKALRVESNQAICYWWGVTAQTVSKWRKALGIGVLTEGTKAIWRKHFNEPWGFKARKKACSKARDPERCRKISDAHKGKPKMPHVLEAMRNGRKAIREESRVKIADQFHTIG